MFITFETIYNLLIFRVSTESRIETHNAHTLHYVPHTGSVRNLTPHIARIIYFHAIKVNINKA